jgi:glycosyltransferase involved in cell wall biosynthesis
LIRIIPLIHGLAQNKRNRSGKLVALSGICQQIKLDDPANHHKASPVSRQSFTILHTEASTGWGGQEIRIFTEMEAMRRRGHRLHLAAPAISRIFQEARKAGFDPWILNSKRILFPFTILKLARALRRKKVEVVNPHSSADGWIAGMAGRLARTPLIIRSRHIEVDYPNRRTSHWAYGVLPHHVITTSERISTGLIERLRLKPDRVQCISTGIDLEKFDGQVSGTLHQELGLDSEVPLVGMISVIRSWKGHDYFVEAAKIVAARFPAAHFVVAGGGNDKRLKKIRRWVNEAGLEDCFHLLGHRTDVPNLLASYSVLVLPSTGHEGIPQIILQSHAMACPVVGTTAGGIPEVVADEQSGLLVPIKNSPALAAAINRLLENEAFRNELTVRGQAMVNANHSEEHMCQQLEALYQRYLSGNRE